MNEKDTIHIHLVSEHNDPRQRRQEAEEGFIDVMPETDLNDPEALLIAAERRKLIEKFISTIRIEEERIIARRIFIKGESLKEVELSMHKPHVIIWNIFQRISKELDTYLSAHYESRNFHKNP